MNRIFVLLLVLGFFLQLPADASGRKRPSNRKVKTDTVYVYSRDTVFVQRKALWPLLLKRSFPVLKSLRTGAFRLFSAKGSGLSRIRAA